MKRSMSITIAIIIFSIMVSCSNKTDIPKIQNVGMLLEGSISDHAWNQIGYNGLQAVSNQFNVDVLYKEGIETKNEIIDAVDEFVQNGVNLIFGHSNIYGRYFGQIAEEYPKVQFVYFNGNYFDENVVSLNFNSHAMGFYGGMIAAKMSQSKQVGVIAAYEWQQEIEGFYEGVKFQDPNIRVHINFVNSRYDEELAVEIYDQMRTKDVDVFYPLSYSFSNTIIEQVRKDNIYAIGYVEDQSYIDKSAVLTSTVQHVDMLYENIAHIFNQGQLQGGYFTFDFQDGFITLGKFSDQVPKSFQQYMSNYIDEYTRTNLLPNES